MDLMYQVMDQVLKAAETAQKPVSKPAERKSGKDGKDFDSMVRQKRAEGSKSDRTPDKSSPGKDKAVNTLQKDSQVSNEQYAMAAAMLLQMQPLPENLTVVTETDLAPVIAGLETVTEDSGTGEVLEGLPENGDALLQTEVNPLARPVEQTVDSFQTVLREAPVEQTESESGTEEAFSDLPLEAAAESTEVFGYMDATPVKVSEPEAPIALEAEDATEQLADRIGTLVENEDGSSRVELTLNPPSLGKVTVEIVHRPDGALHIALQATTEKAVNLLERNSVGLQNLLASQSRSEVHVQVKESAETPYIFVNPDAQNQQEQQRQHQQQQQQQQRQRESQQPSAQDFIQQLRLGLIDLSGLASGY